MIVGVSVVLNIMTVAGSDKDDPGLIYPLSQFCFEPLWPIDIGVGPLWYLQCFYCLWSVGVGLLWLSQHL